MAAWLLPFAAMGVVMGACGDEYENNYDTDTVDQEGWHPTYIQLRDGTTLTCIVNDYKEGVWCK